MHSLKKCLESGETCTKCTFDRRSYRSHTIRKAHRRYQATARKSGSSCKPKMGHQRDGKYVRGPPLWHMTSSDGECLGPLCDEGLSRVPLQPSPHRASSFFVSEHAQSFWCTNIVPSRFATPHNILNSALCKPTPFAQGPKRFFFFARVRLSAAPRIPPKSTSPSPPASKSLSPEEPRSVRSEG